MRLVLDSNEYILAYGEERAPDCEALIFRLTTQEGNVELFVPWMVVDEITHNLNDRVLRRIHRFWRLMGCTIEDESDAPSRIENAYLARGLKPADAQIAAYAEWVRAEILVSENRDFLALSTPLPFRVMKAAVFIEEFS